MSQTKKNQTKKYDYTSMGFYTFDCLGRPMTAMPPGADTFFIDEITLAVSGAAGSAAILAAKHGLNVQAVGGVGADDMGDWVRAKLAHFGVDTQHMMHCDGFSTSSSMVTIRPNGDRPAFHKLGATAGFFVDDAALNEVIDTKIFHIGGVGLMDRMDQGRTTEVIAAAKANGCITTLDVFASKPGDLALIEPLLPHTDYFLPSIEEAAALSGLQDPQDVAGFLLARGAGAVILTMGGDGALYTDQSGTSFHQPAFDIEIVCSCGCGDCFNAGFATGLFLGKSMADCVTLAQASSAQNAMGLGSQAVVSDLASTLAFIERTARKSV